MNRFELVGDVASNDRMSHGARIGQMHDEAKRNRSLEKNGEEINWRNDSHPSIDTSKRGIRSFQILKSGVAPISNEWSLWLTSPEIVQRGTALHWAVKESDKLVLRDKINERTEQVA